MGRESPGSGQGHGKSESGGGSTDPLKFEIGVKKLIPIAYVDHVIFDLDPPVKKWSPRAWVWGRPPEAEASLSTIK